MKKHFLGLCTLALASSFLFGCADGNEALRAGTTTISGNVQIVSAAGKSRREQSGALAFLRGVIRPVKSANAQSAGGILITAFQNGAEAGRDTADANGDFQLSVPAGGVVNLRIEAMGLIANRLITVTPASDVTLRLSVLSGVMPPDVEIDAFEIQIGSIRTRELERFDFDEAEANLTINGAGGDCVRATGSSEVNIRAADINLVNCDNGIVGENFANVILNSLSVPTLSITSRNNGIHAMDDSSIRLTGVDVFISAGTNAILATGTSGVQIMTSGNCAIQGGDDAVDRRDAAAVDTADCQLIVN
ncbi:MAG: hypothetical protein ACT4NX_03800 [Deltaproteobacteria bacterium]